MTAKVKLTRAQADTLLALRCASLRAIDTTCEVGAFDNAGRGTGRRLQALAAKGLCVQGALWSKRAGFRWEFTDLGRRIANEVDLADARSRGELRKAGRPYALVAVDLSGVYEVDDA